MEFIGWSLGWLRPGWSGPALSINLGFAVGRSGLWNGQGHQALAGGGARDGRSGYFT